jgi:hypothetical protein
MQAYNQDPRARDRACPAVDEPPAPQERTQQEEVARRQPARRCAGAGLCVAYWDPSRGDGILAEI